MILITKSMYCTQKNVSVLIYLKLLPIKCLAKWSIASFSKNTLRFPSLAESFGAGIFGNSTMVSLCLDIFFALTAMTWDSTKCQIPINLLKLNGNPGKQKRNNSFETCQMRLNGERKFQIWHFEIGKADLSDAWPNHITVKMSYYLLELVNYLMNYLTFLL